LAQQEPEARSDGANRRGEDSCRDCLIFRFVDSEDTDCSLEISAPLDANHLIFKKA
jgi:hypothetical protein